MSQVTFTEEPATPSTPTAGRWRLYFKATGLFAVDDAGTEIGPFTVGSGLPDGDYGGIVVSGSGSVMSIGTAVVTLAMMTDMATASLIYRRTAGAGVPEVNTLAQLKTDLALAKADVGLANVDNTSDVNKPVSTAQQAAIDAAVVGLLDYKGGISASGNPNYPSALKGDAYAITSAGKVGGASGTPVDIGDVIVASADNAGGTEATVGTSWIKIEHNLEGALVAANNLSDLTSPTTALTNLGLTANGKSLVTAADYAAMKVLLALTTEDLQDLVGAMFAGTQTGITATYNDSTGMIDIVVTAGVLPQNSKSTAYTTVLSDAGKHILHPSADTTARTFTIDSNANVAYVVGTAITFVNQDSAGVVTIAITSDTMRLAGAGTTGSRTLAANGIATALKVTATEWIISGTGLT